MVDNDPSLVNGNAEELSDFAISIDLASPVDVETWLQMGQLRGKTYVRERAFLPPEALDENGAEFDGFDQQSRHLVATNEDGSVLGVLRVVTRGEGDDRLKLPAEELFDVELPDDSTEISRFIVDSKVPRSKSAFISLSLIRAAMKASMQYGENSYAVIEQSLFHYLNDIIGIELEIVKGPQMIPEYNTENLLVRMQPFRVTSQVFERDKKGGRNVRIFPEYLAPFFEYNATARGLGRAAMSDLGRPSPEQYDRNLGFISRAEHEVLQESTVAIAGVGGDGGELAVTLAQLGVGSFKLADPERFEVNNLNRQTGASYETIGKNKAEVIAEMIRAVNPNAKIKIFTDGITEENVDNFVDGSNLVVDETEFTLHHLGVMLARSSRKYGIPVAMGLNVGFGSYTTSFDPDGATFEEYLGLDPNMPLDEIKTQSVDLSRWLHHVPSYSDMRVFSKVAKGEISAPTVSPGVKVAAADTAFVAISHLLSDKTPLRAKNIIYAPSGHSLDVHDGEHDIKYPRLHFYMTAAIASLRTWLNRNPHVG